MKPWALCLFLLVAAATQDARAQWGLGGFGYAPYYNRGIYVDQDRIPYFALHPPVYYSYPVPRPYGYSPFAYPGVVRTPEFRTQEPAVLLNPYVNGPQAEPAAPSDAPPLKPKKPATPARPSADKLGSISPLRIYNPYGGVQPAAYGR